MKIYISVDMEGITGASAWDNVSIGKPGYSQLQQQMTAEVLAACEGCLELGTNEIWIKDAHATGTNILIDELPQNVKVIRGWSGHPFSMSQELDGSFDAMMAIGYHSMASSGGNPLSHTMSSNKVMCMKINGELVSEFMLNCFTAASVGVPVIFATGDENLCNEIRMLNSNIITVAVMKGVGDSSISIAPSLSIERIKTNAALAVKGELSKCKIDLPANFFTEIQYKQHQSAYKASFYPNAELKDSVTVVFKTDDYFEFLRFMLFVI
ncbi:M55 family metallopeptidase [Candidatus Neomarinimicrobiota bacterium]